MASTDRNEQAASERAPSLEHIKTDRARFLSVDTFTVDISHTER